MPHNPDEHRVKWMHKRESQFIVDLGCTCGVVTTGRDEAEAAAVWFGHLWSAPLSETWEFVNELGGDAALSLIEQHWSVDEPEGQQGEGQQGEGQQGEGQQGEGQQGEGGEGQQGQGEGQQGEGGEGQQGEGGEGQQGEGGEGQQGRTPQPMEWREDESYEGGTPRPHEGWREDSPPPGSGEPVKVEIGASGGNIGEALKDLAAKAFDVKIDPPDDSNRMVHELMALEAAFTRLMVVVPNPDSPWRQEIESLIQRVRSQGKGVPPATVVNAVYEKVFDAGKSVSDAVQEVEAEEAWYRV